MNTTHNIILGISGASGAIYSRRLLEILEKNGCEVNVIITTTAKQILNNELTITEFTSRGLIGRYSDKLTFYQNDDLASVISSGSHKIDAMVVCPCSSHSVAAIAAGLANTLLLRSAYVTLKERRPLILVHREMPLTSIDLENMLRITNAGGIICPASPGFYNKPKTIDNLVDAVVGRVLDLLKIDHDLPVRWSP